MHIFKKFTQVDIVGSKEKIHWNEIFVNSNKIDLNKNIISDMRLLYPNNYVDSI